MHTPPGLMEIASAAAGSAIGHLLPLQLSGVIQFVLFFRNPILIYFISSINKMIWDLQKILEYFPPTLGRFRFVDEAFMNKFILLIKTFLLQSANKPHKCSHGFYAQDEQRYTFFPDEFCYSFSAATTWCSFCCTSSTFPLKNVPWFAFFCRCSESWSSVFRQIGSKA